MGVAFQAGAEVDGNGPGAGQRRSGSGSDRPAAQRKSKQGGGKKKGFATSKR